MPDKLGKILAVDFGKKKVGFAVSDVDRTVVLPKGVVFYDSESQLIKKIKLMCEENQIKLVVFGLPYLLDGSSTKQTDKINQFVSKLKRNLHIPIEFVDETLSSFEAGEMMENFPKDKKKKNSGELDILSAQIILQRFLTL